MRNPSFKVQIFNNVLLPLAGFARKIYSPVLYFFLWLFVFRKVLKKMHEESGPNELSDLKKISVTDFNNRIIKNNRWVSERGGGAVDFTYGNPEFFLIPEIYNKWGRDCDDFANLCFLFLKEKGYEEVYQILTTTAKWGFIFKHSHLFTIGRKDSSGPYVVYNVNSVYEKFSDNLPTMVCSAIEKMNKNKGDCYTPATWCVYRGSISSNKGS